MKKILLTLAMLIAGYCSYAQPYLPLTSGSGNALIGTLYSNITADGVLIANNAGTNRLYQYFQGTNAYGLFGIEGSAVTMFTGATANATVIGSKNATPFHLGANGIVYQTITSSGNVGIGTTSPGTKLHIVGYNNMFRLENTDGTTANQYTQMELVAGAAHNYIWTNNQNSSGFFGGSGALNLYTGQASPIAFFTNASSTPQMVVANGGNVGIGTTSPVSKLDIKITGNGGPASDIANVTSVTGATNTGGVLAAGVDANGTFYSWLQSRGQTNDGGYYSLAFNPIGGNVGIGTTAPSDPVNGNVGKIFDINGSGATNTDVILHTASISGLGGGIFGVQTSNSVTGSPFIGQLGLQRIADVTSGKISATAEIDLNNDGTPFTAMKILSTGNVGIGTTIPDAKLTVNGTIHSKEVKVDLNVPVPDYVFNSDYKLPQLSELKTYVDKNHHLPEIPSAAEMAKDGMNLSEMNVTLLKKVEELTLYLIEKDDRDKEKDTKLQLQQKQIEGQNKELIAQQKDIQSLQQQIDQLVKKIKD